MKTEIVVQVTFSILTKNNRELTKVIVLEEDETFTDAWTRLVGELFSKSLPNVKQEDEIEENFLLTDAVVSIEISKTVEIETQFYVNERR